MYQMLTDKKENNEKSFPRTKTPIQLLRFQNNQIFATITAKENTLPLILGQYKEINEWIVPIKSNTRTCASAPIVFDVAGCRIAMHLCFEIQGCSFIVRTNTVNITIKNPHYTARPLEQQELATAMNGSHNVAPNSIHWGATVPNDISTLTGSPGTPVDVQNSIREALQHHTHLAEDIEAIRRKMQTTILYKVENCDTVNVTFT